MKKLEGNSKKTRCFELILGVRNAPIEKKLIPCKKGFCEAFMTSLIALKQDINLKLGINPLYFALKAQPRVPRGSNHEKLELSALKVNSVMNYFCYAKPYAYLQFKRLRSKKGNWNSVELTGKGAHVLRSHFASCHRLLHCNAANIDHRADEPMSSEICFGMLRSYTFHWS